MKETIVRQKCMSLQTFTNRREEILTSNNSAPFDLYCLKEDHKFTFRKPVCDPRPYLLIDSIVNEDDMVDVIRTLQFEFNKNKLLGTTKKYNDINLVELHPFVNRVGDYLVKKCIIDQQHVSEKEFLTLLFLETIDYAAQKDFTALKLACLLNIYISTHKYMKSKDWQQPKEIWNYFKEVLIRLTIEDSPDGQEVFSPEESYDILSHFHTIYMNNLPLVHILVFGAQRLGFVWPFN